MEKIKTTYGRLTDRPPGRAEMDDEQSIWSAERLRALIGDELPGTDIIAVSNREPYIHNRTDDGIELQTPASGLVTALEPVMQACGSADLFGKMHRLVLESVMSAEFSPCRRRRLQKHELAGAARQDCHKR